MTENSSAEPTSKSSDPRQAPLDKAGEFAKGKFEGHDEQIDKATQMGKDYDFGGGTAAPGEPAPPAEGAEGAEERPPAP